MQQTYKNWKVLFSFSLGAPNCSHVGEWETWKSRFEIKYATNYCAKRIKIKYKSFLVLQESYTYEKAEVSTFRSIDANTLSVQNIKNTFPPLSCTPPFVLPSAQPKFVRAWTPQGIKSVPQGCWPIRTQLLFTVVLFQQSCWGLVGCFSFSAIQMIPNHLNWVEVGWLWRLSINLIIGQIALTQS